MSTNPLIPVLDIAHGQAVHAVAGRRAEYRPVESVLAPRLLGDAAALAREYRERLGADQCYVADLDAIGGGKLQLDLLRRLAHPAHGFGAGLMVDAGGAGIANPALLLELGISRVVAGLESLRDWTELRKMVAGAGGERCRFSLDLRDGSPLLHADASEGLKHASIQMLTEVALAAGVAGLLVIDLASVGSGAGPSVIPQLREISASCRVPIYAGGGVRDGADVEALLAAGASGALVGTAIHKGFQI